MSKKRRRKVTTEQKLAATHKKIDEIFEKKQNLKISVKSNKSKKHEGKGNKTSGNKKYISQSKTMLRVLKVNDLKDITPEKIEAYVRSEIKKYKDGDLQAASRLNDRLSALNSLQQGINETNVLGVNAKKEIDFGKIQNYRDIVTSNKVFRMKGGSSWKIPSNREMRTIKDRLAKKFKESNDPLDKIADDYVRYAQITGARSGIGLKQTKSNIIENKDGTVTIIHHKDKNSLTRPVTIYDKEKIDFIKNLKKSSPHEQLFQAFKKDGKMMATTTLTKRINERLTAVSEDLGGTKIKKDFKIEQKIVLHSVRKNFSTGRSLELYDYFMRNSRETENRMKSVLEEMSRFDPKVREKYEEIVERMNVRNKRYAKRQGNKNYKKRSLLTVSETALYLSSCELGHYRTDVIKDSYLDHVAWNEIIEKYKEK